MKEGKLILDKQFLYPLLKKILISDLIKIINHYHSTSGYWVEDPNGILPISRVIKSSPWALPLFIDTNGIEYNEVKTSSDWPNNNVALWNFMLERTFHHNDGQYFLIPCMHFVLYASDIFMDPYHYEEFQSPLLDREKIDLTIPISKGLVVMNQYDCFEGLHSQKMLSLCDSCTSSEKTKTQWKWYRVSKKWFV